jgi:murein DD-endopeptidase MepM/ murein hydrolase activator NlpD
MARQEARRSASKRYFDVVIVPSGEGSKPITLHIGWWKILAAAVGVFLACVAITLAVLIFTPVVMVLPIPNPALEARYGRDLADTQEQLHTLAEDVILLRDYNTQLRRALGQNNITGGVVEKKIAETAQGQALPPPPEVRSQAPMVTAAGPLPEVNNAPEQRARVASAVSRLEHLDLPLLLPVEGFISQEFDLSRQHLGIDIASKRGSPVQAPADGYVIYTGWTYEDGNTLVITHGSGFLTVYKHNQDLLKTVASPVKRGEVIALLGTSGRTSQGHHLHFEVWKDGIPRDPRELLLTPARIQ